MNHAHKGLCPRLRGNATSQLAALRPQFWQLGGIKAKQLCQRLSQRCRVSSWEREAIFARHEKGIPGPASIRNDQGQSSGSSFVKCYPPGFFAAGQYESMGPTHECRKVFGLYKVLMDYLGVDGNSNTAIRLAYQF